VTRKQLEHIIRAAAGNADTNDIVVIGSQAILGTYPEAPDELLESMEADVFPRISDTRKGRRNSMKRVTRNAMFAFVRMISGRLLAAAARSFSMKI
jgi:RNase P protein component